MDAPLKLNQAQIDALEKIARTEGEYGNPVQATSAAWEVDHPNYNSIHIRTAKALEKRGLVKLLRIGSSGSLWNEPPYTNVELTDAGRAYLESQSEKPAETLVTPPGYSYVHEKCSDCVRLAHQAKSMAEARGISMAEFKMGQHAGTWKA